MGLNVSTTNSYMLDNQEVLRNAAKNILSKGGASAETTKKIIEQTLFNQDNQIKDLYINPQLSVIKASTQISLNNSLKETLKYLKEQATKKNSKEPIFGELWNIISVENNASEKNPYKGELSDFQIDKNAKNIFVAA